MSTTEECVMSSLEIADISIVFFGSNVFIFCSSDELSVMISFSSCAACIVLILVLAFSSSCGISGRK